MKNDPRAQKITEIWLESLRLFFKLQALGKETGAVAANNSSTWGFLHTLMTAGPSTVPKIARMRPVSRQHIQIMANDMEAEGLIRFTANPKHKRSKLVEITDEGRAFYDKNSQAMLAEAASMVGDISQDDLETTSTVLNKLLGSLEQRLARSVN